MAQKSASRVTDFQTNPSETREKSERTGLSTAILRRGTINEVVLNNYNKSVAYAALLRERDLTPTRARDLEKGLWNLWAYDMGFITKKLVSRDDPPQIKTEQLYTLEALMGRIDETKAGNLEIEFKKFMSISLMRPGEISSVSPSRQVDMYWHLFVLHTSEYRNFCDSVFRRMVNHVPATDEEARQHSMDGYERTIAMYDKIFGPPDPHIWNVKVEEDTCGASSPGCGNCSDGGVVAS